MKETVEKEVKKEENNLQEKQVTLREFLVEQCRYAQAQCENLKQIVKKKCKDRELQSYYKGVFVMGAAVLKFLDEYEKQAKQEEGK